MNLLIQEHLDGCAVACLAMVTGTTYGEALKRLHNVDHIPEEGSAWTSNEALLEALKGSGFEVLVYTPRRLVELGTSILVVRYLIGVTHYMHVVVWDADRQTVLDPFPNGRPRPLYYYEDNLCLVFEIKRKLLH